MYTKQEEFLAWLAEVKVRESARRRAGARFTHPRCPRHARRLSTSQGSASHAAPHHSLPFSCPRSTPGSLPRRASCTSTAANGRSRSTSTRFARTTTRRRCPPRSTTTYRRGTPPSRPRGARRRCGTPRGGRARTRGMLGTLGRLVRVHAREPLPSRAYRTSQPASPSTPPHLPPRQVKAVERTSFDDEGERQAEIARGRAERQDSVVRVRRCLGLGPGRRARAAAGAGVGVGVRVR